jgi:hypothetical protein
MCIFILMDMQNQIGDANRTRCTQSMSVSETMMTHLDAEPASTQKNRLHRRAVSSRIQSGRMHVMINGNIASSTTVERTRKQSFLSVSSLQVPIHRFNAILSQF